MFERGNQNQQRELKEIAQNIQIDESLLRMYRGRLLHFTTIEKETRDEIARLEQKIVDEFEEFSRAPVEIEKLEKRIVNHNLKRDKLTGKITGHTKMINRLHKMQADMADLEREIEEEQKRREVSENAKKN